MQKAILKSLFLINAAFVLCGQRISEPIDGSHSVVLEGLLPPQANLAIDQGTIDPLHPIRHVSILFKKTAAQQADFDRLLASQLDPRSPDYMRWLTPAQYAERFGLDSATFGRIRTWLEKQGLSIEAQATSRTWIAFSGVAAQIDNTFRTNLHLFEFRGKTHYAPTQDPSVPEALRPVVLAIRGLDDFTGQYVHGRATFLPAFASGGQNALTPDDLAAIYDIAPLYSAGINGSGQNVAIVGTSSVNLDDLAAYQTKFGLPVKNPQLIAVADPAIPPYTGALSEASLDLELSAAIARGVNQIYVYSDRVEDAATYAIDNAVAPVLSMSFQSCENNFTATQSAVWEALAQEAASKGITWVVSSGDSGPADCDIQAVTGQVARNGVFTNLFASTTEVTAVGGTEFNDASTNSRNPYWNSANGPYLGSAGGYIRETAWDDSAIDGSLLASGGGKSRFFTKPSWQVGPGVPNDGARDVPDVALAASAGHDGFFICTGGECGGGHGGTSAATPMFAGIVVLLNQSLLKAGVLHTPGLGNINPMLYQLAQSNPTAFHDIQTGSNIVPCLIGSPDCATGSFGFPAGPNYDLATGLGSVDATQLNNAWVAATNALLKLTCTMVTASAAGISENIVVTVKGGQACGGRNTTAPAGTVTLTAGATRLGSASLVRGSTSSTATFTVFDAELPLGMSTLTAFYIGNTEYLPSAGSTPITIAGSPTAKPSVQVFVTPDRVFKTPTAYGNAWNFTLTLREINGANAHLVGFKLNGQDASAAIVPWFGNSTLDAFGSVSVPLQITPPSPTAAFQGMTVSAMNAFGSEVGIPSPATPLPQVLIPMISPPDALTAEIDLPGPTAGAANISATFTASLLGRPGAASLQLTGAPSAVLSNPSASPSCQWSQQLLLRELAGTGVTLQHFHAGSIDMSAQIGSLWGATRIPAGSALSALMCWSGVNAPILINYEIDGMDDSGNTVSAALTSPYLNPAASPNTLTVTQTNPNAASPNSNVLNLSTAGGTLVFRLVTTTSSQVWTVSVIASGQSPAWLTVYPLSGMGSGNVLVAPVSGLSSGIYNAVLVFQSADAQPQMVSFPVTFTVQ